MLALCPEMTRGAFLPLKERLDANATNGQPQADDVRDLLAACEFGAEALDQLEKWFDEALEEGLEARKAERLLSGILAVVELALRGVYPPMRMLTADAPVPPGFRADANHRLSECETRASAFRQKLGSLRRLLDTPPPNIEQLLPKLERLERDPKNWVDSSEYHSKLLAGEDV